MARRRTLALVVIGSLAGLFSGLFGVGGGVVMVPLFLLWLRLEEREATGTSLAAIVLIAAVATATHAGYGTIDLVDGALLGVTGAVGVTAGTAWQQRIAQSTLRRVFAGVLVLAAVAIAWP